MKIEEKWCTTGCKSQRRLDEVTVRVNHKPQKLLQDVVLALTSDHASLVYLIPEIATPHTADQKCII